MTDSNNNTPQSEKKLTDAVVFGLIGDHLHTQTITNLSVEELDQLALFKIDGSWTVDELGLDNDAPHGVNSEEEMRGNA